MVLREFTETKKQKATKKYGKETLLVGVLDRVVMVSAIIITTGTNSATRNNLTIVVLLVAKI